MRFAPFDPMQVYRNRDYACHRLDKRVFKALNESGLWSGTVHLSCSGCLDAIDQIPGGSMRGPECGAIQSYVGRDSMAMSPQERRDRDALAARLIDEILAEEQASSTIKEGA